MVGVGLNAYKSKPVKKKKKKKAKRKAKK